MSQIETAAEASELNRSGQFGPYRAANGHLMIAPIRYPIDEDAWRRSATEAEAEGRGVPPRSAFERDLRVGDEVRYDSFAAWCAPSCNHDESGPAEDW